jgi:hypothetical protein
LEKLAKSRGSTPIEQRCWRKDFHDHIREVMSMQGGLSIGVSGACVESVGNALVLWILVSQRSIATTAVRTNDGIDCWNGIENSPGVSSKSYSDLRTRNDAQGQFSRPHEPSKLYGPHGSNARDWRHCACRVISVDFGLTSKLVRGAFAVQSRPTPAPYSVSGDHLMGVLFFFRFRAIPLKK